MKIDKPLKAQIPELRSLWKEAFGDTDEFLDIFEAKAFSLDRCRCITVDDSVVAALYWFDCQFMDKPIAYIYAVATTKSARGQGLCHALMKDTHKHLRELGYVGTILVPGSNELFHFYEGIGYETCTHIQEISFEDSMLQALESNPISLRSLNVEEYAQLRRNFLPKDAVIQEEENLDFLQTQADFYAGDDFLLAASKEGDSLHGIELLGNTSVIPELLQTFGCSKGRFRVSGKDSPFGMYYPLVDMNCVPSYFGFAFD